MSKYKNFGLILIFGLIGLDFFVYWQIFFQGPPRRAEAYFLDVGQGDSELIVFPGGVKVLIDAGPPTRKAQQELEKIFSMFDRYIDLVIISHPETDHFGSFDEIIKSYQAGAVIINGRDRDSPAWQELMAEVEKQKIPLITLAKGDQIKYQENLIDILSPGPDLIQSAELNDVGLVTLIKTGDWRLLATADIGSNVENILLAENLDLKAEILKIGHHGSKYSSSEKFLKAVNPKAVIIEVGSGNRYGHPTQEILTRLQNLGIKTWRTDLNGTIKITRQADQLQVVYAKD